MVNLFINDYVYPVCFYVPELFYFVFAYFSDFLFAFVYVYLACVFVVLEAYFSAYATPDCSYPCLLHFFPDFLSIADWIWSDVQFYYYLYFSYTGLV